MTAEGPTGGGDNGGRTANDPPLPPAGATGPGAVGAQTSASQPATAETTSPAPLSVRPTLEEIGRLGKAFVLTPTHEWLRRHVETVEIITERFARRRLTIDVRLPHDATQAAGEVPGGTLFFLPVAHLAKAPLTSNIDLVDETGASLALLNRDENADVTAAALAEALKDVVAQPSPLLTALVSQVVHLDGIRSAVLLDLAERALADEAGGASGAAELELSLGAAAANSFLWLPLVGMPGQRRVVQLRYDVELQLPPVVRRRAELIEIEIQRPNHSAVYLRLAGLEDDDPRSTLERILSHLMNLVGWGAVDLYLDTPHIRGPASYHLQVAPPRGVETRGIALLAELEDESGELLEPETRVQRSGAHLYFTGARVTEMFPAVISLRVGRRGFLSLSLMTSLVITTMLWCFESALGSTVARPEISAATLLVVPAALTALVLRGDEPAVTSRLLTGVRFLLLASALLAAAAAAALADIKPHDLTLREAWFWYAIAASAISVLLSVSWILSLDTTHRLTTGHDDPDQARAEYLATGLFVVAGVLTALGAGCFPAVGIDSAPWFFAPTLGAVAIASVVLAAHGKRMGGRHTLGMQLLQIVATLTASVAAIVLAVDGHFGLNRLQVWRICELILTIGLLLFAAAEVLRWRRRR